MARPSCITSTFVGVALGFPLLAWMYFGRQVLGMPFAPFDLFSLAVRHLPGLVVTGGVETMVGALQAWQWGATDQLARYAEAMMAAALFLLVLAVPAVVYGGWGHRLPPRVSVRGSLIGLGLWGLLLPSGLDAGWNFNGALWMLALGVSWGVALAWALKNWAVVTNGPYDSARRRFLVRLGTGALAVMALGLGLGRWLRRPPPSPLKLTGIALPTPLPDDGFVSVEGTRPEITAIPDFYQVSIKLDPPHLDANTWALDVGGLVETPITLTYADITNLPAENFYATLECISNQVGGDLIGTTLFTGVALREVLNRARLRPEVVDIAFTCADGYSESLSLEAALDPNTRLVYAMGGAPLTPEHGFPLRLFAPDRFGMKHPKWITNIEAVADDVLGFWQKRRWSDAAWAKTTSVIDAAHSGGAGRVDIGGIAYAGARAITTVEVRVDEGEWVEARLKPALSAFTWVLWRAEIAATPGPHEITVRATDGRGVLQSASASQPFPEGATGLHHFAVNVD
jgi:DMSO/TMAO reductase YedYZ molybdopterin-dependent catalytic subunit